MLMKLTYDSTSDGQISWLLFSVLSFHALLCKESRMPGLGLGLNNTIIIMLL